MFTDKRFDSTGADISTAWGGGTVTCTVFALELGKDPRGLDLQLSVDALNGDTWHVDVLLKDSVEWRLYNDNGGAGFDGDGVVLIDDVMAQGFRVVLTGAAATDPALVVNMRRRGL